MLNGPGAQPGPFSLSGSGPDVVVEAELVGRIVRFLNLCQTRVVRSVRRFDAVIAFVADAQEIDVDAAW